MFYPSSCEQLIPLGHGESIHIIAFGKRVAVAPRPKIWHNQICRMAGRTVSSAGLPNGQGMSLPVLSPVHPLAKWQAEGPFNILKIKAIIVAIHGIASINNKIKTKG